MKTNTDKTEITFSYYLKQLERNETKSSFYFTESDTSMPMLESMLE